MLESILNENLSSTFNLDVFPFRLNILFLILLAKVIHRPPPNDTLKDQKFFYINKKESNSYALGS